VNVNNLGPKIGAVQMGPKTQICDFPENDSNDFDYISGIYGDNLPE
jgi:hypothetical protein